VVKRELILHIGTSKTGSTSLQHVLSRNRRALFAQGVCYPRSPGSTQHKLVAYAVKSRQVVEQRLASRVWSGDPGAVRVENFFEAFDAELAQLPAAISRVILSSEFIYILVRTPEEVRRLRDRLLEWFHTIKVVVYLRRQDAHFTSLYSQILRGGEVLAPDQIEMRVHRAHELDYEALLDRWAEVYGQDNIVPRLFEKSAGKRFDSVQDFLTLCGLTVPDSSQDDAPAANPSMDLAGQHLLVDIGRVLMGVKPGKNVGSPVWRQLTDAVTSASPGRGWQPTRSKAAEFYSQFKEGNDAICRTWFPDRATLFDEDFSEYPETAPTVAPDALYQLAIRLIVSMASQEVTHDVEAAHEAVRTAQKGGNRQRHYAALTRAMRHDPTHPGLKLAAAELYIEDGQLRRARGLIDVVLDEAPDDPVAQALDQRLTEAVAKGAAEVVPEAAERPARLRTRGGGRLAGRGS
jgi:hypothetical protein